MLFKPLALACLEPAGIGVLVMLVAVAAVGAVILRFQVFNSFFLLIAELTVCFAFVVTTHHFKILTFWVFYARRIIAINIAITSRAEVNSHYQSPKVQTTEQWDAWQLWALIAAMPRASCAFFQSDQPARGAEPVFSSWHRAQFAS
jgi:hypothetical protein